MTRKKPYHKPKTIIRLCPNCKSIQRVGTNCSICKHPIIKKDEENDED